MDTGNNEALSLPLKYPSRQFWDCGRWKSDSLLNFSIVGCQWTVNCLLGWTTCYLVWHKEIIIYPVLRFFFLRRKGQLRNGKIVPSFATFSPELHSAPSRYCQMTVDAFVVYGPVIIYGSGGSANKGMGKNFTARKWRGAKFQCTEIWRLSWNTYKR